jgi:hypothetical protein
MIDDLGIDVIIDASDRMAILESSGTSIGSLARAMHDGQIDASMIREWRACARSDSPIDDQTIDHRLY